MRSSLLFLPFPPTRHTSPHFSPIRCSPYIVPLNITQLPLHSSCFPSHTSLLQDLTSLIPSPPQETTLHILACNQPSIQHSYPSFLLPLLTRFTSVLPSTSFSFFNKVVAMGKHDVMGEVWVWHASLHIHIELRRLTKNMS